PRRLFATRAPAEGGQRLVGLQQRLLYHVGRIELRAQTLIEPQAGQQQQVGPVTVQVGIDVCAVGVHGASYGNRHRTRPNDAPGAKLFPGGVSPSPRGLLVYRGLQTSVAGGCFGVRDSSPLWRGSWPAGKAAMNRALQNDRYTRTPTA